MHSSFFTTEDCHGVPFTCLEVSCPLCMYTYVLAALVYLQTMQDCKRSGHSMAFTNKNNMSFVAWYVIPFSLSVVLVLASDEWSLFSCATNSEHHFTEATFVQDLFATFRLLQFAGSLFQRDISLDRHQWNRKYGRGLPKKPGRLQLDSSRLWPFSY